MAGQEASSGSQLLSDVDVFLKNAVAFEKNGKYESALMSIEKALSLNENCADAWLMKGVVLSKSGKCEESLRCLDRCVALNPNCADAWCLKAATFSTLNLNDKAADCMSKAVNFSSGARRMANGCARRPQIVHSTG